MNETDIAALHRDLAAVVNTHGVDNELGIPDHIIARVMLRSIVPVAEVLLYVAASE